MHGGRAKNDVALIGLLGCALAGPRLISANPLYEPYGIPAQDVHMVGKVVWVLRTA